jgi:hypothetical protein
MLLSPVLPSFSQSHDYPTLSHCHKPLQLGIAVLARCCPRHGRTVVAPPAVRSSRPYTSGHRICPPLLDLSSVLPSGAGGAIFSFCTSLVALGIIVLYVSTRSSDSGREPGSPVHWYRLPPSVATNLASPVCALAFTMVYADPVLTWHGVTHSLAIIGLAALMSTDALGSPSSPLSLPSTAASAVLVEQTSLVISEDVLCSPSDLDDERLSLEVLLHVTYEVVS